MGKKLNGKRTTQEKHRGQNSQLESDAGSVGNAGSSRSTLGHDQVRSSRSVRARQDSRVESLSVAGNAGTGGILRQLIDEYREEINIRLAEVERLQTRVGHFERLLEELEQRGEENL
jgi:hypothetical protein